MGLRGLSESILFASVVGGGLRANSLCSFACHRPPYLQGLLALNPGLAAFPTNEEISIAHFATRTANPTKLDYSPIISVNKSNIYIGFYFIFKYV